MAAETGGLSAGSAPETPPPGPAATPTVVPGRQIVASVGAAMLTLASFAFAFHLYRDVLGLLLLNEQFLAGMLGLALALVFVSVPARGAGGRTPWYDWILAALGLGLGGYMAVRFPALSEQVTARPLDGLIVAFLIVPMVLEALRRTAGLALTIVVLVFLAYALVGHLVPGQLAGRSVKLTQLAYYLTWDPGSLLGTPVLVAATIVIAFIFFGQILFASGGSAFFTDVSLALMGRYRGGSAKIAIAASSLFGTISGSAVSNVTSTGIITIPLMRRGGYPPQVAGAIEAVASTGGQLMPPVMGAAAFLMAEFLQVAYRDVVIAAAIPALLYYAALFVQVDLLAARMGIARVPEAEIPSLPAVLARGWHFLLPFAVLIGTLFWWNWSPERAALAGAGVLVVAGFTLGYGDTRLTWRAVLSAIAATGHATLDLLMITAAAGFIIGVLNLSGLGFSLTLVLVQFGSSSLLLLLLVSAVVCIVLGMGMPTVGVYVLLAALIAPAIIEAGATPMAAHMFVLYFGMMSMITPPVALAAYAAASLAQTDAMRTGWAAVRLGWVAFIIPFLFVRAPSLLFEGDTLTIAVALATALFGVWLVSAAFVGYALRPLTAPMRAGFAVAGLLLFIPAGALPSGYLTDVIGLVAGAVLVLREVIAVRGTTAGTLSRRAEPG